MKLVSITLALLLLASSTLATNPACSKTNCGAAKCCDDSILGGVCYSEGNYDCVTESSGRTTLCGKNLGSCSSVCYDASKYHCDSSQKLAIGAEAAGQPKPVPQPSPPKPADPAPKPDTPKPDTPKPSQATTPKPVCGTNCASGQGCCGVQCFDVKLYSCPVDLVTKVGHLCPLSFYSCNGKCYNPNSYKCVGGDLQQGAESSGNSQPVVTNVVPNPVPNPVPVPVNPVPVPVNPVPVPVPPTGNRPAQKADLRMINNCKTTLYFEGRYGNFGKMLPGQSSSHTKAAPGAYVDFTIPAEGLSGTRFWAKYGCDDNGKNCIIGDQMQYYPEGGCPAGGCTPPVDSLFEATWGCKPGSNCFNQNPTTWFDTSQVDGWTIPYKLTANGATNGCDCVGTKCGFSGVDASRLDLKRCPSAENMAFEGINTAFVSGKQTPLNSIDLRIIDKKTNSVIGCMSPCKKLNWGLPYGMQLPEATKPGLYMCCPTPNPANCRADQGCISPLDCRNGPIEKTQYVKAVHDMAPGIYSYSYDDGVGLHACPAGTVTYTMEFCPTGSSQFPLPL